MRTETELNEALAKAVWLDEHRGNTIPDFCHSLDACVKWLKDKFLFIRLDCQVSQAQWNALLVALNGKIVSAREDTPARAFCRAAEQSLDAEARP